MKAPSEEINGKPMQGT